MRIYIAWAGKESTMDLYVITCERFLTNCMMAIEEEIGPAHFTVKRVSENLDRYVLLNTPKSMPDDVNYYIDTFEFPYVT
jgi:hypothetical protein